MATSLTITFFFSLDKLIQLTVSYFEYDEIANFLYPRDNILNTFPVKFIFHISLDN